MYFRVRKSEDGMSPHMGFSAANLKFLSKVTKREFHFPLNEFLVAMFSKVPLLSGKIMTMSTVLDESENLDKVGMWISLAMGFYSLWPVVSGFVRWLFVIRSVPLKSGLERFCARVIIMMGCIMIVCCILAAIQTIGFV